MKGRNSTVKIENNKVILEKLEIQDASFLYEMYSTQELQANFDEIPFLPGETPEAFTQRIISACEYIWTIRPVENPESVIGDCALHHWDESKKEIKIGGSLVPAYWGKGLMQAAFAVLINIAREQFEARVIVGHTKTRNIKAIRLAEKMGFEKVYSNDSDTIMRKFI